MKRVRHIPSILVVTDRVGEELANGSQVFADALLSRLARWFDLTVLTQQAVRPSESLTDRVILVPSDEKEDSISGWLVRELERRPFSLIYNLGGTSFSCHLTRLITHLRPYAPLVNHFQVLLSEYARHEGWSEQRVRDLGQVQQTVAERAHRNIFPSFAELKLASAAGWNIDDARNYVVPNAFVAAGAEPEFSFEKPCTFLAAGRFSDYVKGADLLYRAFSEVHKRHPSVRLEIASDDRRFLDILRPLPSDSWKYLGWLSRRELHTAMGSADAVIVPSRYEPFGLVAVEAMAMGTPVTAMAVGGLAEIIQHEHTGWLCPPWEGSLGLQLAMDFTASDRRRARRMGSNARRAVKRDYLLSRVAQLIRVHLHNTLAADGAKSTLDSLERSVG